MSSPINEELSRRRLIYLIVSIVFSLNCFVNLGFLHNCISGNSGFKHFDVPDIYKLYGGSGSNSDDGEWVSQFKVDDIAPFGPGQEDHLLPEYVAFGGKKTHYYQNPIAIYVKGGPVLVKGTYKGRYTIVTDEYQTYKRHAWGAGYFPPNKQDTLWTDIWLTGDIKNNDYINDNRWHTARGDSSSCC